MYAQAMVSNTESPIDRNHILNNGEPNFTQKIELHTKEKKSLNQLQICYEMDTRDHYCIITV